MWETKVETASGVLGHHHQDSFCSKISGGLLARSSFSRHLLPPSFTWHVPWDNYPNDNLPLIQVIQGLVPCDLQRASVCQLLLQWSSCVRWWYNYQSLLRVALLSSLSIPVPEPSRIRIITKPHSADGTRGGLLSRDRDPSLTYYRGTRLEIRMCFKKEERMLFYGFHTYTSSSAPQTFGTTWVGDQKRVWLLTWVTVLATRNHVAFVIMTDDAQSKYDEQSAWDSPYLNVFHPVTPQAHLKMSWKNAQKS